MENVFHFFIVPVLLLSSAQADDLVKPVIDCPEYVHEGDDLVCECKAPAGRDKADTFWPHSSSTPNLTLPTVNRNDDGKIFDCRMRWNNQLFATSYTLRVAFGPSSEKMKINGPDYFVTDGSRYLTLTCTADEVNPAPVINWLFGPCNHGLDSSSCTFSPNLVLHQNKTIECKATNPKTGTEAKTEYDLHLEYPPQKKPVINGHIKGQIHRSGDKLSCIVTGGEPLVSKVIFNCTNPPHEDEKDVKINTSVLSSVTFDSTKPTNNSWETVCTCSAIWDPEPGLYTLTDSVSFALLTDDDDDDDDGSGGVIAGITVALVVGVVLAVALTVFICKKRRGRNNTKPEENDVESTEPLQSHNDERRQTATATDDISIPHN